MKNEGIMEAIRKQYYYILTYGCQLNENDSEKICGMLEEMEYARTEDIELANIYVMNTCCVRENAEEKVFGKLRRIRQVKRENGRYYSCWRVHDAGATRGREIEQKLSVYRHYFWYTYIT